MIATQVTGSVQSDGLKDLHGSAPNERQVACSSSRLPKDCGIRALGIVLENAQGEIF